MDPRAGREVDRGVLGWSTGREVGVDQTNRVSHICWALGYGYRNPCSCMLLTIDSQHSLDRQEATLGCIGKVQTARASHICSRERVLLASLKPLREPLLLARANNGVRPSVSLLARAKTLARADWLARAKRLVRVKWLVRADWLVRAS